MADQETDLQVRGRVGVGSNDSNDGSDGTSEDGTARDSSAPVKSREETLWQAIRDLDPSGPRAKSEHGVLYSQRDGHYQVNHGVSALLVLACDLEERLRQSQQNERSLQNEMAEARSNYRDAQTNVSSPSLLSPTTTATSSNVKQAKKSSALAAENAKLRKEIEASRTITSNLMTQNFDLSARLRQALSDVNRVSEELAFCRGIVKPSLDMAERCRKGQAAICEAFGIMVEPFFDEVKEEEVDVLTITSNGFGQAVVKIEDGPTGHH